jgi:hypothetical protein
VYGVIASQFWLVRRKQAVCVLLFGLAPVFHQLVQCELLACLYWRNAVQMKPRSSVLIMLS